MHLQAFAVLVIAAFLSVARVAATGVTHDRLPTALAPGLKVLSADDVPLSVGAAVAASRTWGGVESVQRLFVHCDAGSDERDGRSLVAAVASVHRARELLRELRATAGGGAAPAAVVVEVRGTCYLEQPLTLESHDAGSSSEAPVVWQGRDGAVLSAGRIITQWEAVSWPGAQNGTVLRASVVDWPLDITSLRLVPPASVQTEPVHADSPWLKEWIPRTRYPKADPTNYSAGWLTTAGWTCPTDLNQGDIPQSTNWSIGIEANVPNEALAEPTNLYFNG